MSLKKITSLLLSLTVITLSCLPAFAGSAQSVGPRKLLAVLVEFSDVPIQYSDAETHDRIFKTDGATVNNYLNNISNGKLYYTPAVESYGTANDGIIKVKLNYNAPVSTYAWDIVRDASIAADPFIDYSSYDTDNNGFVDAYELTGVFIIAGYTKMGGLTEGLTPFTQPMCSGFINGMDEPLMLDGKSLYNFNHSKFTVQGELYQNLKESSENRMSPLGVIVHELIHTLYVPDLYDDDSKGVGIYSLMGTGGYGIDSNGLTGESPTHLDPLYKEDLGFYTSSKVNTSGVYTLYSTASSQYNIIKIPTTNPNQYFLLENRQLTGYDYGLNAEDCKDGGILIWHVDKAAPNNDDENNKMLDVEEANEGDLGYSQLDMDMNGNYDHFYYVGGHTSFSSTTTPNSNLKGGTVTGLKVEVLSAPGEAMDVRIDFYSAPQNLKATQVSDSVELTWDAVAGAPLYEVEIDGIVTTVNTNKYTINQLTNGIHKYKVRASNGVCSSSWSKTTTTRDIMLGDVNQDNSVTYDDYNLVKEYILGITEPSNIQKAAADVDGDGDINSTDYSLINRYLQNIITVFPAGSFKHITYGDVNCNGSVTRDDLSLLSDYLTGSTNLSFLQLVAANADGYNTVDGLDYRIIEEYINGYSTIPGGY